MKKLLGIISLAMSVILTSISICSCAAMKTHWMKEDERARFLAEESDKQIDRDKFHCTYYITVSVDYKGEKYTKRLEYTEYYDAKNSENVKYKMVQKVNELEGVASSYTYVNGTLYISSGNDKIQGFFDNLDQAYYHIPFYNIYYNIQSYAYVTCPQISDGKYVAKYTHTSSEAKANMYSYLYWAVPERIYTEMYACQFVDEFTYNKDYRLTQYKTHIDLKPRNAADKGYVSIDFKQILHYNDFSITEPKDADEYRSLIDPI